MPCSWGIVQPLVSSPWPVDGAGVKCPSRDEIDLLLSGGMCLRNTLLLDFFKSFFFFLGSHSLRMTHFPHPAATQGCVFG